MSSRPNNRGTGDRRRVDDHRRALCEAIAGATGVEGVLVREALGRVTAEAVTARVSLPPFDNSAMDGFAVRAGEVSVDRPLPVSGRIYAGDVDVAALTPGTAAAIMTGAPLPAGADAVIQVEHSAESGDTVRFDQLPTVGDFVRRTGDDVTAGTPILAAGVLLTPRHLGALAAAGVAAAPVYRRPRVAVISTGSELVAPGARLRPGQIYESNATTLAALCTVNGAEVVGVETAGDGPEEFEAALESACARADLVLTSGGISMGEREPVRQALGAHGWFGPVAMQPGGPQGLAHRHDTVVCCFPGNPVSVLVSFEVLLRDGLRALSGLPPVPTERARLTAPVRSVSGKQQFRRGRRADRGTVELHGGPGSHLAVTAAAADVLIQIEAEVTDLAAGEEVTLWPLS